MKQMSIEANYLICRMDIHYTVKLLCHFHLRNPVHALLVQVIEVVE